MFAVHYPQDADPLIGLSITIYIFKFTFAGGYQKSMMEFAASAWCTSHGRSKFTHCRTLLQTTFMSSMILYCSHLGDPFLISSSCCLISFFTFCVEFEMCLGIKPNAS